MGQKPSKPNNESEDIIIGAIITGGSVWVIYKILKYLFSPDKPVTPKTTSRPPFYIDERYCADWCMPETDAARAMFRNGMRIRYVPSLHICAEAVQLLRRHCLNHPVVGFDCEWNNIWCRDQVALVQVATQDGTTLLFHLACMEDFPQSLKEFIEDPNIYKVGVALDIDRKHLQEDYAVTLQSFVDLRHLAQLCGRNPGGLAKLSEDFLNITLDKGYDVRCSDWNNVLTKKQIFYAAADAYVATQIYKALTKMEPFHGNMAIMRHFSDITFKYNNSNARRGCGTKVKSTVLKDDKDSNNSYMARKTPLYTNCYLEAPDGDILTTCDVKKAKWYIAKGLADKVKDVPLTVRLKFEPSGRAVGSVGEYYKMTKDNKCVVCGYSDSYIRKNVVPREYRKYFPDIMKDHSSHDVVLLCVRCHKASNVRDQPVRRRLGARCGAPLEDCGHAQQDTSARKIRSAARALLNSSKNASIPEARRRELEAVLLQHYPDCEEVTQDLLQDAANVPLQVGRTTPESSHGLKVVEYYMSHEGLLRLEELWRQHFLDAMRPRHLPPLWSLTHSEQRLNIKLDEGRLDPADSELVGVGLTRII